MVVPGGKGSLRAFSPESLAGVCCLTRGSMLRRLPGPFGVWACGTENTVQAARVRPVACQCRGGEGSVTLVAEGRRESRKQKAEGRRQKAEGRRQRAEGRGQKAEGRGQRAEGRGQKAESRRQKAEGRGLRHLEVSVPARHGSFLLFLLPFAFCHKGISPFVE